ncbi:hypothetical protein ATHL_01982 [Anaerolinea thermolimosa]|uniref:hypothetical protein n=1 Tax=Anaerolinea thermolimosa TaxID=229919 RepID=UPI0007854B26|nr:hypothetical protein [Anaerolinea thermolimosa]GAP07114.1 hypothetical protein ATHL_01982 [Anaerolinea thermolimosa]
MQLQPIYNDTKFRQKLRFPRLNISTTLTDMDFVIEKSNILFVFGEVKETGKDLAWGQKILYERVIDAINYNPEKRAIFLQVWHHNPPPDDILLEDTVVVKAYSRCGWQSFDPPINTVAFIEYLLEDTIKEENKRRLSLQTEIVMHPV